MRIDDFHSLTRPGIADAQGFSGSGFDGDGGGHACRTCTSTRVRLRTHTLPSKFHLRHRRRDADQAVVVLHQGFCERQGYDAFLLHVELAGGAAPIGKAVHELLVSLGQGDQGRTNFLAQAKARGLHRIKAPVLVNGVGARGIRVLWPETSIGESSPIRL